MSPPTKLFATKTFWKTSQVEQKLFTLNEIP
ncbi:hypothetical protein JL09_g6830 [Pichia kudriavzevii]|uniref:Uncharacterized protein n=1 Tax=Pichia kudriavzevii TaxID=4909 RepID=A0A099NIM1_PICKU|nr:hypothetical protein JL09_g6835 [Pichia kudriavzevii]KGK32563.1 hypothetical protein JL09_g6830 [Pichia kudriavzevii]